MKVRNAGSVLKNVFNGPCFHQMMFLCLKNVPGLPGCFSGCILQWQTSTTHSKFEIYPKMIVQRSCWCPWVLSTNYCLTFQIFQKRFTRQLHTNWQWDVYTSCILWKASFSQSSCVSRLFGCFWPWNNCFDVSRGAKFECSLNLGRFFTDLTRKEHLSREKNAFSVRWTGKTGWGQLQWERTKGSIRHGDGSNMDSC